MLVDESYFSGRRKYRRRRLLSGDRASASTANNDEEELSEWDFEDVNSDFGLDNRNWAWLVGIYHSRTQVRFV